MEQLGRASARPNAVPVLALKTPVLIKEKVEYRRYDGQQAVIDGYPDFGGRSNI
jgi:hypothetical protein